MLCTLFILQVSTIAKAKLGAIQQCQVEAQKVGTTLADVFNAPPSSWSISDRMRQLYLVQNLGFCYDEPNIGFREMKIRRNTGWRDYTDSSSSKYWSMTDKWLYFYGDSTLRQLFEAIMKTAVRTNPTAAKGSDEIKIFNIKDHVTNYIYFAFTSSSYLFCYCSAIRNVIDITTNLAKTAGQGTVLTTKFLVAR